MTWILIVVFHIPSGSTSKVAYFSFKSRIACIEASKKWVANEEVASVICKKETEK